MSEAEKVCNRCGEQPRRPKQRWCRDCHAAYVRELRERRTEIQACGDMGLGDRAGVYFIRCHQFVKIGQAGDVVNRYRQIKTSNPFHVVPLGFVPEPTSNGLDKLEFDLHCKFGSLHHRGEWFKFVSPLVEFVAEHAKPWPVPLDQVFFHVEQTKPA
jgi:hypothetical protein